MMMVLPCWRCGPNIRQRRQAVRAQMQQRYKVGGMLDRRFGENNPSMTPEERALERFVREKQRSNRKKAVFDLEDDSEDGGGLTHLGQSLAFTEGKAQDDFEDDMSADDADAMSERRGGKRPRLSEPEVDGPDRPKSKNEVMEEVIAKSKLHKYERQKAKEEDDELREEVDAELKVIHQLLRKPQVPQPNDHPPASGANRTELYDVVDSGQDKSYDERVRQLALDARSKPAERTKTDEENAVEHATHLQQMEQQRLRRMMGKDDDNAAKGPDLDGDDEEGDATGLGQGLGSIVISQRPVGFDDEDDFVLDPDLVAAGSDLEFQDNDDATTSSDKEEDDDAPEDESDDLLDMADKSVRTEHESVAHELRFTYPCPGTHQELLNITSSTPLNDLPTIVQRIRALYHPKLDEGNKAKLARFATVLVDHISFLGDRDGRPSFSVLETLIRHVHSLAKSFPEDVARAFRAHLQAIHESRSTKLTSGDLILLTAIATIFPTSDHFHQVATPGMLSMTRYLGLAAPQTLSDLSKGAYVGTLCLQYQSFARRYVPELTNYVLNSIHSLSPIKPERAVGEHLLHEAPSDLRIENASEPKSEDPCRLHFWSVQSGGEDSTQAESLKVALLQANLGLIQAMTETWRDKSAAIEILEPLSDALDHLKSRAVAKRLPETTCSLIKETSSKVDDILQGARRSRRPLELHHHRPLPIKTSVPKFEESYNPDKTYDPDRERAEHRKLQAAHRKERKAVLRDFRKDAGFLAREQLRERKERDARYETKFRRLVAEIQGEEGREANAYEREKRLRKGKW